MFSELTKMVPRTMEDTYKEAQKFVDLERELKPIKKECSTTPVTTRCKEKIGLSLENTK